MQKSCTVISDTAIVVLRLFGLHAKKLYSDSEWVKKE